MLSFFHQKGKIHVAIIMKAQVTTRSALMDNKKIWLKLLLKLYKCSIETVKASMT